MNPKAGGGLSDLKADLSTMMLDDEAECIESSNDEDIGKDEEFDCARRGSF